MADRFPSIEDIDENSNDLLGGADATAGNGDDFRARERAALGDDADLFTTADDNMPSVNVENGDLMGSEEVSQFQSSYPAVDSRSGAGQMSVTGAKSPAPRAFTPQPSYPGGEEPEVVKEWRERREAAIAEREDKAAQRKEGTVKEARTAIDEFYENYNNKKEKGITQTRQEEEEFLKNREDTTSGGTSWQRIAKLVDVKPGAGRKADGAAPGGKDRFKEMLGSLAKDENAPGAKGY